ncbi:hypothetical protein ACQUFY_05080 [Robbsia andropogonis]|uniref:hypothetical protein n=1 Tax=Robbsia andropogonis TaxID=28092 RepID=UPI003D1BF86C
MLEHPPFVGIDKTDRSINPKDAIARRIMQCDKTARRQTIDMNRGHFVIVCFKTVRDAPFVSNAAHRAEA